MRDSIAYAGNELLLFARAVNWKGYFSRVIHPYCGKRVLEVGAGLGGTTSSLCRGGDGEWVCLEPDPNLFSQLQEKIAQGGLPPRCRPVLGTLSAMGDESQFDTILYIDVLEHIEKDREELLHAMDHLSPGGHLIVLSPALPFLFSPFDAAIGHWRRYTRRSLTDLVPGNLTLVLANYLDSVGLLASLTNRLFLRQDIPGESQILFWDRVVVPISRIADPLFFHSFGRAILGIWRKH